MNASRFTSCCDFLNELADSIVAAKRPDYTQLSSDILANFKRSAEEAGITPRQAWLVHFHKQYSAVAKNVKSPSTPTSEGIHLRFSDLRNYLYLGFALWVEEEEARTGEPFILGPCEPEVDVGAPGPSKHFTDSLVSHPRTP